MDAGFAPNLGRVADAVETFAADHRVVTAVLGVLGLALLVVSVAAARATVRAVARLIRAVVGAARAWSAKRPAEDRLTIIAASIATAVSAQGMWRFSEDVLGLDGPLRLLLFAFIEVAVVTSAVRARRSMRENRAAGLDGLAVWAFTCLSAVLSTLDSRSLAEAVFRLASPLVAAWLWERGMSIERHRLTGRGRIHWRLTPERILVRIGLADASDRTTSDIDRQRRITAVALAAKTAHDLREAGAPGKTQAKALRRLHRAFARADKHTGLARDEHLQRELAAEIAALYDTSSLLDITPASAWTRTAAGQEPSEVAQLAEETRHLSRLILDRRGGESLAAVIGRQDREGLAALATLAAAATGQHLWPVTPTVTPAATRPAVTNPVTTPVTDQASPAPADSPVGVVVVTPGVTESVTGREIKFDITNPAVFDLHRMLHARPVVTPPVTPNVTGDEGSNPVPNNGQELTKTQLMRAYWDQERAHKRYPGPAELARHAGADPSLASRLRQQWVAELDWRERRAASKGSRTRDKTPALT